MHTEEKAAETLSVEELRARALNAVNGIVIGPEIEDIEAIKAAQTYAQLVIAAMKIFGYEGVVDDYPLSVSDLYEACHAAHEQLARIEQEHLEGTSLVTLRDQVVGIVTVSGYKEVEKHSRSFLNVRTYDELRTLVRELCQVMEANYFDQAHARLRRVLATLDNKIAHE
jgi:hypothetical protein